MVCLIYWWSLSDLIYKERNLCLNSERKALISWISIIKIYIGNIGSHQDINGIKHIQGT